MRRSRVVWCAVTAVVVSLSACGGGADDAGAPAPPPVPTDPAGAVTPVGFPTLGVMVRTPDGREIPLCLWLAEISELRAAGLANVDGLGGVHGTLFRFPEFDGPISVELGGFTMLRTRVPLTVVFYDDGAYVSAADMEPCTEDTFEECPLYPPEAPYTVAIEVLQGDDERLGLVPGSTLIDTGTSCEPV